jgi:phage tail-like protein
VPSNPNTPDTTKPLGGDLPIASAFEFIVDDHPVGIFREVSGLGVKLQTEPITEGGQNGFIHQLPGRMEWEPITFKRGLTHTDNLFKWFWNCSGEGFASSGNKVKRSTAAIVARSYAEGGGRKLRTWNLVDAFPIEWKGPEFKASHTDGAVPLEETLIVVHHGFTVVTA